MVGGHPRELMRGVDQAIPSLIGNKPHLQSRRKSTLSRVARESKSNETGSLPGVVFAHNDFCRHFANPILRLQCEPVAEA